MRSNKCPGEIGTKLGYEESQSPGEGGAREQDDDDFPCCGGLTAFLDLSDVGLASASHVKLINDAFDTGTVNEGPEYDAVEAINTDRNVAATDTGLNGPADVAVNNAGDTLYIADRHNSRVHSVDLTTGFITRSLGRQDHAADHR